MTIPARKRVATTVMPPVSVDRDGNLPIYGQLYEWFRGAITEGRLRPGQRVPSTRSLAAELKISRIPVLSAYEQLRTEGYLETVIGAGTRVAQVIVDEAALPIRLSSRSANSHGPLGGAARRLSARGLPLTRGINIAWPPQFGAFRIGLPALEQFPVGLWAKLAARHTRRLSKETMAYGEPMGYLPLREAIADYLGMARALRCDASQVLVTAGSQQGLALAAQTLFDAGDEVCIEEPGYPGQSMLS